MDLRCMHTLCTLFLGVCTPCADFFWVHAHFFQTLKIPPFSPNCTGSFRIPVSLIGLITSPTSLDRNSKVLFSVVLKGLKSLHSLHGVHEVCTGLPPDVINYVTGDVIDHVMRHVMKGLSCNVYVIRHVILCNGSCNQQCNRGCNGQCNEHVT